MEDNKNTIEETKLWERTIRGKIKRTREQTKKVN